MVILKSPEEIKKIKESNRIVADVLQSLKEIVRPGLSTLELNKKAETIALQYGAEPAFKGYRGYPFSLCASVNSQVVHGFPSRRVLVAGDIVSLDFGIYYNGYYGDAAITCPVGEITAERKLLLKITEESLYQGIAEAKVGNRIGDISYAVQSHVEKNGFSVVRDYVGHGIGKNLHEDPPVPNYGSKGCGIELKSGMVLAIEPMVNEGTYEVKVRQDGWTVVTADGKMSAHFEHTVAITEKDPVILSRTCS